MYSKCIVSPLIRTPIAIIASKVEVEAPDWTEWVDFVRSVVLEERRSVAEMGSPAEVVVA
jgi:hypothetical protein